MSTTAFQEFCDHCENHGLPYQPEPDKQFVRFHNFQMKHGAYNGFGKVEDDWLVIGVLAPYRIPPGCRPAIAETVCRINDCLKIGRLDLDFDDGTLACSIANRFEGSLPDSVIGSLILRAFKILDLYAPAFLSVTYSNESPKLAVRQIMEDLKAA